MLTISEEQLNTFLLHDEPAFVDFIIEHLNEESPELIDRLPLDTLREMVRNGISRAKKYGLHSPEDITAFVAVMFEIAPNFDEQPEIHQVLRDERILIDKRFDSIFEKVSDEAWEEADRNYDHEAWFPELKNE